MTYVLGDDKTYRDRALRRAGKDAALLHTLALYECAGIDGDGVLDPMLVKDAAALFDLNAKRLAPRLVAEGVWHDAATLEGCGACLQYTDTLREGELLIHRWWEPLLHKDGKNDPVKRDRELRRKRLWRDKNLVLAVRKRWQDCCAYCGIACSDPSGPDKKDPNGLTLDHVDPWGGNTSANVVVACRRCNGVKRDRRPDDAGMALLKPGTRVGTSDTVPEIGSATGPVPARDAREAGRIGHGSGRIGAGSGPVAGRVPDLARKPASNGLRGG